ncbi:acyltransferase family protein [Mucilaginibacter glaciei]|uniref:Acyltransferase n=1 Tax=Mucilaginibacter glaciei TaxID=2772109 RepID=A0A926S808_9SPHI|nr:acyltransferase [Mucilaginibacter glaciei]MBD1395261.1 acyltransferase [Mucilaginibacter glaciei]
MGKPTTDILKPKQHFEILDGLRGVAALAVVCFHFMEVAYTDYSQDFIGHGFLAVDFFFCLSGFVIGYAYDDRMGKMGAWEFFKSRLIRLHPLVVLGSVMGLLAFVFDPFTSPGTGNSAGNIALVFLASVLMIPASVMTERAFNLFSFNAPAWSLFWEYVANIIYAFVLFRIRRKWVLWLTILSGVGICIVAYQSGNLMGGWGGSSFWDGSIRISYSFLAGLLVYRSNWIIKNNLGFTGLAMLIALAFLMPFTKWNFITEPLVVLFYFPLLVALGAGAALSPSLEKLCKFSGDISYPLYMTHYAVIWMFAGYYAKYKPDATHLTYIIIISMILLVGIAWLVMVFYDMPLRRYLSSKRKPTKK